MAAHRRETIRKLLCCLVALGLATCSATQEGPEGQLILVLESDMTAPQDYNHMRVQVLLQGNVFFDHDYPVATEDPVSLKMPATIALLAGAQSQERVTVRVIVFKDHKPRVLREAHNVLVPQNRVAMLRMHLGWLCEGQLQVTHSPNGQCAQGDESCQVQSSCSDTQATCIAGGCQSAGVDSAQLPAYSAANIFGGGTGQSDGTCFDTQHCFEHSMGVSVHASDCTLDVAALPAGELMNVALVPAQSTGICGFERGCLVPLDQGEPEGWKPLGQGRIQLPNAVCLQLQSGKAHSVVVSTSCATKQPNNPVCGAWSSVGTLSGAVASGGHGGAGGYADSGVAGGAMGNAGTNSAAETAGAAGGSCMTKPGTLMHTQQGAVMTYCGDTSGLQAKAPWPMRGYCPTHEAQNPYRVAPCPKLLWKFRPLTDQAGIAVRSSPAVSAEGVVYIGFDDGYVYALNAKDGSKLWAFKTGGKVQSSPAIGKDGTLYVGSNDSVLYAVNPDGMQRWAFKTGAEIHSSPVISPDGSVYVGSNDSMLHAVDASTGKEKVGWPARFMGPVSSSPALDALGNVYVGSEGSSLSRYSAADGNAIWSLSMSAPVHSSPALGADGTIYSGADDGKLYAINSDKSQKWAFATGNQILSSVAISSVDSTVYVGSDDTNVYAIEMQTGVKKWAVKTNGSVQSSAAIDADGTVYIGSADGRLYAIHGDGTKKWIFPPSGALGAIVTSPAIGTDGVVFFGADDGYLYAIGP